MGGGGMPSAEQMQQVQQQQQQQKEMREKVLESLLTPEAMDRIKRIALVKEDKVGLAPASQKSLHTLFEAPTCRALLMQCRQDGWRI